MKKDHFKLISAVIAISIYLLVTGAVLYYFNYRSSSEKSAHYVKKNSDAIAVSLAGAKTQGSQKAGKKKRSSKRSKHKPKKIRNISTSKPTAQKSKKAKKIQAKNLFSSLHTPRKPSKNNTSKASSREKSASEKVADALKKPHRGDKGRENRYFASVEEKLRGWPAQANYAGETISVWLKVYPSGSFEFKLRRRSANSEFNEALIAYLKQLQSIGLGRHSNPKPYVIEVEFEAIE